MSCGDEPTIQVISLAVRLRRHKASGATTILGMPNQ